MNPFYIFAAPGALILIACCLVFCLKKKHGFGSYFLLGWTLLILLSLPAGIWQSIFGWSGLSAGSPLWNRLITRPLIGWPFNAAGFSIRFIFDMLGKELYGRGGDMLVYLLLMALQTSIIALLFAGRYKRKRTFADWIIISLGILFLLNSLVNVNWYWGVG